jgi:hypothetical protein
MASPLGVLTLNVRMSCPTRVSLTAFTAQGSGTVVVAGLRTCLFEGTLVVVKREHKLLDFLQAILIRVATDDSSRPSF